MPAKPDHPVTTSPNYPIHPLLKWAGGKRQLLPALRRFYPARFHRYIEPFFGSGAVFFDLHSRGLLRDRDVVLIDSNADLIGCYETVRDNPGPDDWIYHAPLPSGATRGPSPEYLERLSRAEQDAIVAERRVAALEGTR